MTRILLLLVLLAPPVAAQQAMTFNGTLVMPSFGPQGQDHATIAVNAFGDVFVAWHAELPNGSHLVEGMLVPYNGAGTWLIDPAQNHFLLGDATLGLLGQDTCIKPDVVALEDGSFVVAWTRGEETFNQTARLEAARIHPRDTIGRLASPPSIDTAAPGEGVVLDPVVTPGQSRLMVDLVALGDERCAAVYAHEASYVLGANGDQFREYDLRAVAMDWNLFGQPTGFVDGPYDLMVAQPMDSPFFRPFIGGLVLPDVVTDDLGNLVVAWETYWVSGHGGVTGPTLGSIKVARFAPFTSATPLALIDTVDLPTPTADPYRRPNLSTSRTDAYDNVSLAFAQDFLPSSAVDLTHFMDVDYSHGFPVVTPRYWNPPANSGGDYHPVPLHAKGKHFCLASRVVPNGQRRLIASFAEGQSMILLPTPISHPWRPALVSHPGGPGNPGYNGEVVFITYEGANNLNPANYQIRLTIRAI